MLVISAPPHSPDPNGFILVKNGKFLRLIKPQTEPDFKNHLGMKPLHSLHVLAMELVNTLPKLSLPQTSQFIKATTFKITQRRPLLPSKLYSLAVFEPQIFFNDFYKTLSSELALLDLPIAQEGLKELEKLNPIN